VWCPAHITSRVSVRLDGTWSTRQPSCLFWTERHRGGTEPPHTVTLLSFPLTPLPRLPCPLLVPIQTTGHLHPAHPAPRILESSCISRPIHRWHTGAGFTSDKMHHVHIRPPGSLRQIPDPLRICKLFTRYVAGLRRRCADVLQRLRRGGPGLPIICAECAPPPASACLSFQNPGARVPLPRHTVGALYIVTLGSVSRDLTGNALRYQHPGTAAAAGSGGFCPRPSSSGLLDTSPTLTSSEQQHRGRGAGCRSRRCGVY